MTTEPTLLALHRTYAKMLHRYAYRITHDWAAAEDLVQETWIRVWRYPGEPGDQCSGWLCTILRRIAIDHARARAVRPTEHPLLASDGEAVTDHADATVDRIYLAGLLAAIPRDQRAALVATESGLTEIEAGRVLGVPPGTVKSRRHYGVKALRRHAGVGQ